ncbi:MAG TPA: hypothetical protein VJL31_12130 [Gemmatimonadales bacterium]|jgi:hypothetical protein|nr:hypothetical protein [Gemmatimonadales bacterium]
MPNAEISLPPGAQLGYTIAVASGEFELALDGTVIARVDRPLSDEERWHVSQLKPGIHRLDLTARNLGAERYNAEVRLWVGDPAAPIWKTVFTYRSNGKPGSSGAGHTLRLNVRDQ